MRLTSACLLMEKNSGFRNLSLMSLIIGWFYWSPSQEFCDHLALLDIQNLHRSMWKCHATTVYCWSKMLCMNATFSCHKVLSPRDILLPYSNDEKPTHSQSCQCKVVITVKRWVITVMNCHVTLSHDCLQSVSSNLFFFFPHPSSLSSVIDTIFANC